MDPEFSRVPSLSGHGTPDPTPPKASQLPKRAFREIPQRPQRLRGLSMFHFSTLVTSSAGDDPSRAGHLRTHDQASHRAREPRGAGSRTPGVYPRTNNSHLGRWKRPIWHSPTANLVQQGPSRPLPSALVNPYHLTNPFPIPPNGTGPARGQS